VTHDLEDAFALADRIAVLNEGRVEQADTPEELYRRPASLFVSTYVGKAALIPGTIEGGEVRTPLGGFENPRSDLSGLASGIEVVVRPEDVGVTQDGLPARVVHVVFAGDRYLVRASTGAGFLRAYCTSRVAPGDSLRVRVVNGWPIERSA
jgi:iron(III) transport system ATP-binding protein